MLGPPEVAGSSGGDSAILSEVLKSSSLIIYGVLYAFIHEFLAA
jgi:hypothetical protein